MTIKIKTFDLLAVISLIMFMLLNPFTGQYVIIAIDNMMEYGVVFISTPVSYLIGYGIYRYTQYYRGK